MTQILVNINFSNNSMNDGCERLLDLGSIYCTDVFFHWNLIHRLCFV